VVAAWAVFPEVSWKLHSPYIHTKISAFSTEIPADGEIHFYSNITVLSLCYHCVIKFSAFKRASSNTKFLFVPTIIFPGGCEPGTFSYSGAKPCSPCPLGTYQPDYNRASCLPCPAGVSTVGEGASQFIHCLVGTYHALTEMSPYNYIMSMNVTLRCFIIHNQLKICTLANGLL